MEASHYAQLIIGLMFAVGVFAAGFVTREKTVMWLLLLLIPFQPIMSRYGSVNEMLVYAVGLIFILKGRVKVFPLTGSILFLFLVYLVSFVLSPRFTHTEQIIYLGAIASNFVLFYLVYNFVLRQNGWQVIWKILVVLNILVLGYCALQLIVGFGSLSLFGVQELSLTSNIEGARRLTGPFGAVAMTAEYLVIQTVMLMYAYTRETRQRRKFLWVAMSVLNFGFLFATGNRGGIVALAIGAICFFFLFRKELGTGRVLLLAFTGVFMISAISLVMIRFTQFNILFDRFESTEFEGFVPDTRSVWVDIWPRVVESPIVGHGPRLRLWQDQDVFRPGYTPMPYPHNLYMYIFYTIGGMGLLAYVILFFRIGARYYRSSRFEVEDKVLDGLPRVGLIVLVVFAASEMRMEMLRFSLHDYQQYLFMVLAAFLALSNIKITRKEPDKQSGRGDAIPIPRANRILSKAKEPQGSRRIRINYGE